jgi:hypothetical protein
VPRDLCIMKCPPEDGTMQGDLAGYLPRHGATISTARASEPRADIGYLENGARFWPGRAGA